MAVVQISRIQNRRGRKNSQTGFPQLASGELGWAIDTQELYIGNGAVSEGAPAVGNTKILTEHDDILNYVTSYTYAANNTAIQTGLPNFPVKRTLQDRLDDFVSIRSFGAVGNGTTDDTVAIQTALDQLFINTATKSNPNSRVVLYFEAGEYMISNGLKIPPYAHLVGAGIDSTIIKYKSINVSGVIQTTSTTTTVNNMSSLKGLRVGMILSKLSGTGNFGGYTTITNIDTVNNRITISSSTANTIGLLNFTAIENQPLMRFVDGNSTPGNYTIFGSMNYLQRPRNILIEGMTISKVHFPSGNYVSQKYTAANGTVYNWDGNTWLRYTTSLFDDQPIVYLDNTDTSIFNKVKFEGLYANGYNPLTNQAGVIIRGVSGVFHTENIAFQNCIFESTGYGVYSDCDHDNVLFNNCKFYKLYDALNLGGNTSGNFVVNTTATASDSSNNQLTVGSSQGMFVGMPISFAGSVSFGGIVLKSIYYVSAIIDSTTIKISQTLGGSTFNLSTSSGLINLISTNAIGASNTKVSSCYFDLVERYGIWIKLGSGNTSIGNKYLNVGNLNEGYANATYPIIKFDTDNNQSSGDYFERNTRLKDYNLYGLVSFIPNVSSSGAITDDTNFRKVLYNPISIGTAVPQPFFRLPVVNSSSFVIDYTINKTTNGTAIRTGRLFVTVDLVAITSDVKDEFNYTGSYTVENVWFTVELHDYQGNGNYTLLVMLNNTANNGTGTVSYSYRSLSV